MDTRLENMCSLVNKKFCFRNTFNTKGFDADPAQVLGNQAVTPNSLVLTLQNEVFRLGGNEVP